jgi:hypothetical protein
MLPGINTAIGVIAKIVDTLWPSKKAALVDELRILNKNYELALTQGRDTDAAILRKKMDELRKKVNFCEGEL